MAESGLRLDEAIDHWGYMRNTTHAYYRLNFKKLLPTLFTLIALPGLIYYGMIKEFVSFTIIIKCIGAK